MVMTRYGESATNAYAPYRVVLSKVPGVFADLSEHGPAVTKAAAEIVGQWKTWFGIHVVLLVTVNRD
jgi:hypothetical protein